MEGDKRSKRLQNSWGFSFSKAGGLRVILGVNQKLVVWKI